MTPHHIHVAGGIGRSDRCVTVPGCSAIHFAESRSGARHGKYQSKPEDGPTYHVRIIALSGFDFDSMAAAARNGFRHGRNTCDAGCLPAFSAGATILAEPACRARD